MEYKEKNGIDSLFDEKNEDDIVLTNGNGESVAFHKIAFIPLEKKTYVILQPVEKMEGVGEDEALVFSIETNDDGVQYLSLSTDSDAIDKAFEIYYKLFDEANSDDGK